MIERYLVELRRRLPFYCRRRVLEESRGASAAFGARGPLRARPWREPRKSVSGSPLLGCFDGARFLFAGALGGSASAASTGAASTSLAVSRSSRVPYFAQSREAFAAASMLGAGSMLECGARSRVHSDRLARDTADSLEVLLPRSERSARGG